MRDYVRFHVSKAEKKVLIEELTKELATLRAKANVSQDELSNCIGVSRQTYGSLERRTSTMSWNTYLSIMFFYEYNKLTRDYLRSTKAFPHDILRRFNQEDDFFVNQTKELLNSVNKNIYYALDEQAMNTIKTVAMVEYLRCNPMAPEVAFKFFEGNQLFNKKPNTAELEVRQALANLKKSINQDD